MKPSERGLALIRQFEGLRLSAYRCAAGVLTIGWGTTKGVKMGMEITRDEADRLLLEDAQRFADHVKALVKVPLNQNQTDALAALVYNIGPSAFAQSTLLKRINDGRHDLAASEFERWVNAGGKRINGLVRRRAAERALYESMDT